MNPAGNTLGLNDVTQRLEGLSDKEKSLALSILREFSQGGKSSIYDSLLFEDYDEIPVTIDTFISDDNYLGKGLVVVDESTGERKQTIFPYWQETLRKVFPNSLDTNYNTLIFSGAIGLGKSLIAVVCILYMLYRLLCLKDPYKHFGLQPIDHITISFMNITLDAAKGVAWAKCQELLQSSPWFLAHGTVSKSINPEWSPSKGVELIYGSLPRHVIGRAVYASFEDEVSFQPNQDVSKQIEKAKTLISSIDARMQSRFMKGERLPTLHILASSKRTDQSFLETYIDMKKKNESKTTLVIDEPQWVIRTDKDSPRKFALALGNKFLESEVLPLNVTDKEIQSYVDRGYRIMYVPMGYYENFIDDLDIALTDIAGISTSNTMSYISGARWAETRNDELQNPFTKEILTVGDGPDDKTQYCEFFDMNRVPQDMKSMPMYIHLDMSVSGDKTGIAGVWIKGMKPPEEGKPQSKELYYQVAFSVAIKAPKGRQISFEKNRQFIFWLRDQGFNIRGVSSDIFQSVDTGQSLKAQGFDYKVISVDRVEPGERICRPYQTLKSAIYEERVEIYPTKLLTDEIIGLVRDSNGKVDHSPSGINSKDTADAVCGALFNASQHAEEFSYDYGMGKTLVKAVKTNTGSDMNQQQMIVDMEAELNKMFEAQNPMAKQQPANPQQANQNRGANDDMLRRLAQLNGVILW